MNLEYNMKCQSLDANFAQNRNAASKLDLCNAIWRPHWIFVVSRDQLTCATCAIHQIKVNFVLNKMVPVNLSNLMNNFEAISKEFYFGGHHGIFEAILK